MPHPMPRTPPCSVRSPAASFWVAVVLAGCAAPHLPSAPVPTAPPAETARPALRNAAGPGVKSDLAVAPVAVETLARPEAQAPASAPATVVPDAAAPLAATDTASAALEPGMDRPFARGKASWYGTGFHGRRTASGERYDMHAFTAAHRTLPFGTRLRVRSVHTGREVVVRINDRGPYKHQRVIDLSRAAMLALGTLERGVTEVELRRE